MTTSRCTDTLAEGAAMRSLVRGVSHRFGASSALDDVSLAVPRGAFVVLLGPNGAGKSTLFALVTRLYDNVSGEIRILGHDVRRHPTAALRQLGVVFQSRSLDSDLSLLQNLTYHAALHGIGRREGAPRAREALARVGLADRADDKVRAISGGQARRVEIARALLHEPGLPAARRGRRSASMWRRARACSRSCAGWSGSRAWACSGRRIWSTRSAADDQIVLLHKGRVLFAGPVPDCSRLRRPTACASAFMRLTESADAEAA